jgi:hypothetical protein
MIGPPTIRNLAGHKILIGPARLNRHNGNTSNLSNGGGHDRISVDPDAGSKLDRTRAGTGWRRSPRFGNARQARPATDVLHG